MKCVDGRNINKGSNNPPDQTGFCAVEMNYIRARAKKSNKNGQKTK